MDAEELLRELDPKGSFERRPTGYWARWPGLDVRAMARVMRAREVRLVTVTGTPEPSGGLRLIYHWDCGEVLLNLETVVSSGHVLTISDILPAADWAEREIRDYYGPDFDGRAGTPPLMLRAGDPPGLFTRTQDQGRQTDPARSARASVAAARDGGSR